MRHRLLLGISADAPSPLTMALNSSKKGQITRLAVLRVGADRGAMIELPLKNHFILIKNPKKVESRSKQGP
jgi:hypothetical protein